MSVMANGEHKIPDMVDMKISIGQIAILISIVASALIFYFTGQTNVGERMNKVESELNSKMMTGDTQLSDRISKLETRAAVIEQHQTQTDSNLAETRTNFNAFVNNIQTQVGHIIDQISDLRPLLQSQGHDNQRRP